MDTCERCGKAIPEDRTVCPSCGTPVSETPGGSEPATEPFLDNQKKTRALPFDPLYEDYIPQPAPIYERNYAARPANPDDPPAQEATSIENDEKEKPAAGAPSDGPHTTTGFTTRFFNANTNAPLILEVLLTLLMGIFGVGWLLIDKKLTGMLLLAGSLFFYLPLLIISYVLAYFSLGLSVLCTGPLAIGAVLLNALMLNKAISRKRVKMTAEQ